MKNSTLISVIIILVLIVDQALKFYIKLNLPLGGGFNILGLDWARIHFIENEGMAFGLKFGGVVGKYILTIFRIMMVGFLFYILKIIINEKQPLGLQISFALIIAGAIGNILDSIFYGLIFSKSGFHLGNVAELFPESGGYASLLQGKVVDMFYFPMVSSSFPDWLPVLGGRDFEFFSPVFNVADSAISVGVVMILLFYRSFFLAEKEEQQDSPEVTTTVEN